MRTLGSTEILGEKRSAAPEPRQRQKESQAGAEAGGVDSSETVEWNWRRWAVHVYAWRHSGQPPRAAAALGLCDRLGHLRHDGAFRIESINRTRWPELSLA